MSRSIVQNAVVTRTGGDVTAGPPKVKGKNAVVYEALVRYIAGDQLVSPTGVPTK